MRLDLVPVRYRGNIVGERKIRSTFSPPQILDSYAQITIEAHRVSYVPAVQSKPLLRLVKSIRLDDLRQSRVRIGELLILVGCLVLKIVGAVEIVFRAGSIDG